MNIQEELKQAMEDYATLLPELEAMVQRMEKLTKKILRCAKIVLKEKKIWKTKHIKRMIM